MNEKIAAEEEKQSKLVCGGKPKSFSKERSPQRRTRRSKRRKVSQEAPVEEAKERENMKDLDTQETVTVKDMMTEASEEKKPEPKTDLEATPIGKTKDPLEMKT